MRGGAQGGTLLIRFENVHKTYGTVHVLRGLYLTVREGECAVLIGPSGCGKTTALKMVNRLLTPTAGRVLVNGVDVAKQDPVALRRNIGYVIQETGLFPNMTIAENVALVPRLQKWPKARRDARVDELLHLVGLDPAVYRNRYPRHLSGGQRQRVGVARALAADPPIILMDEPFGATDPITRKQLQRELVQIQRQVRKTILFVTHDIAEAFTLGDTVCLLRDGQVVQHATPEEMVRRPADPFVRRFIGAEAVWRRFEYLKAGEIPMTPLPVFAPDTPLEQVARRLDREGVRLGAVADGAGRIVGLVDRSELAARGARTAADAANRAVVAVRSDDPARECFRRLEEILRDDAADGASPAHGVVILDPDGFPQAIVTPADVVRLIAGMAAMPAGAEAGDEAEEDAQVHAEGHGARAGKAVVAR